MLNPFDGKSFCVAVRVSPSVLTKVAMVAAMEVPGIQDVEDVASGATQDGQAALYLRLVAAPGSDPETVAASVKAHVSRNVTSFLGTRLKVLEIELEQGCWPGSHHAASSRNEPPARLPS